MDTYVSLDEDYIKFRRNPIVYKSHEKYY